LAGYFNDIMSLLEKKGDVLVSNRKCKRFVDRVNDNIIIGTLVPLGPGLLGEAQSIMGWIVFMKNWIVPFVMMGGGFLFLKLVLCPF